jgi:hypothetical protein
MRGVFGSLRRYTTSGRFYILSRECAPDITPGIGYVDRRCGVRHAKAGGLYNRQDDGGSSHLCLHLRRRVSGRSTSSIRPTPRWRVCRTCR